MSTSPQQPDAPSTTNIDRPPPAATRRAYRRSGSPSGRSSATTGTPQQPSSLNSQFTRYGSLTETPMLQRPLEFGLAAGIAVVHELDVGAWVASGERHPQRVQDQVGAHVAGELPAHDHPAVGVNHEREEHDTFPAAQIGEVRQPQTVWPVRREVAVDEVRVALGLRVRRRGPPRLAAPFRALDGVAAHQPLDSAATDLLAGPHKRLPHPS